LFSAAAHTENSVRPLVNCGYHLSRPPSKQGWNTRGQLRRMEERGRLADGKVCKARRSSLRGLLRAGQTILAPLTAPRCPLLGTIQKTSVLYRTGLWDVGRTTHGRHWDTYTVSRRGKWRAELLVAEAAQRIRYSFGTTGGEISGERACKRRSAKHLEFLPSLFEGRRSIQLSYGRSLPNFSYCNHLRYSLLCNLNN